VRRSNGSTQDKGRDPSRIENDALLLSASLRRLPEPEGRRAVLQRLRMMKSPEVADAILVQWKEMLPAGRAEAVRLLVERTEWATKLLTAVERGTVAPVEIPLATGEQLLRHSVPAIRLKAGTLLARIPGSSRRTVLTRYQGINSVTADPGRGPELFEKNCAQCHAMRGRGHDVGPNLAEFAGKSVQDFLLAILDPNAGINPNYLGYELQMRDGRTLSGVVRNETASGLTLVQGGGTREAILRSDITALKASSLSLMPEGLEQALTPQDMADLVAWIKGSAPAQFGSASKEQAANAQVEFSRDNGITSPGVMTCVERLPYPSWMGRQPLAYCRQSAGQERLVWKTPPSQVAGARALFRLPAAMGFISQPRGKFTLKVNGGSSLEFDATLTDHTWETPDGRLRMNYAVREANSEDSNGVLLIDVSQELLTGKNAEFEVIGSSSNSQRWFGIYVLADPAAARR
jgi:putative heme-binding domain-containing protein